ncbi:hypothetical protein L1887_07572 [Cichorium endivia]|nr:hypothetical protein L1887_07572 [Cichorium endivia]
MISTNVPPAESSMISNKVLTRFYNSYSNAELAEYDGCSQSSLQRQYENPRSKLRIQMDMFHGSFVSPPLLRTVMMNTSDYRLSFAANELHLCLIWEQIAILYSIVDEWDNAVKVGRKPPKMTDHRR